MVKIYIIILFSLSSRHIYLWAWFVFITHHSVSLRWTLTGVRSEVWQQCILMLKGLEGSFFILFFRPVYWEVLKHLGWNITNCYLAYPGWANRGKDNNHWESGWEHWVLNSLFLRGLPCPDPVSPHCLFKQFNCKAKYTFPP